MNLYVGTSGFSYPQWKGSFYPEKLPAKQMLSYYAGQLPAVEINSTFYRMPKLDSLQQWAAQVPESFCFAFKASRQITHIKRLKDVADSVECLFKTLAEMGEKLGPVLFQLPPNFPKDAARLNAVLEQLPQDRAVCFEFRHASWFVNEVYELLRAHNVALCQVHSEDLETPGVATADWGYLRLRRCEYTDQELQSWLGYLRAHPWKCAYVFFKHEDEATGPTLAKRLIELSHAQS